MEPITDDTIKVVSASGAVLVVLSLIGTIVVLYAFLSSSQIDVWGNWLNTLFLALFGIAIYYLAFSLLSWILLKNKKVRL